MIGVGHIGANGLKCSARREQTLHYDRSQPSITWDIATQRRQETIYRAAQNLKNAPVEELTPEDRKIQKRLLSGQLTSSADTKRILSRPLSTSPATGQGCLVSVLGVLVLLLLVTGIYAG